MKKLFLLISTILFSQNLWTQKKPNLVIIMADQWGPEHEADMAIKFFENSENQRKADKPFALMISMNPPHTDYSTVPDKYLKMYENVPLAKLVTEPDIPTENTEMGKHYRANVKYYFANITGVDAQIKRIIEGLKKNNLLENSIVVITADHGNCLGKHNNITKNNIYEESISIPFLISYPHKIKPRIGSVFLGSVPDIMPTLLELTNLKDKTPKDIDGKSYAKYFKMENKIMPTEQFILGGLANKNLNKRSGFRGIRTTKYKIAYQKFEFYNESYFFNLKKDPFEMDNNFGIISKEFVSLQERLLFWLKKTNDPF